MSAHTETPASPIRAVVVGTGTLGRRYARVLTETPAYRLAGVLSRDPERGRRLGEQYRATRAFVSLAEVAADDAVDAVCVATPDFAHAEPAVAALAAGKHVLVEKPLATSVNDAVAMVRAAAAGGRTLLVNYSMRLLPENVWLHETIRSGMIGRLVAAESLKSDVIAVPLGLGWAQHSSPVHFLSSHDIDLLLWFFGSRVRVVAATAQRGVLAARGVDTYDSIRAVLQFENGADAGIHSSWIHPESFPTLVDKYLQILGTDGVIHVGRREAREIRLFTRHAAQEVRFGYVETATEVRGTLLGSFRGMLDHFADCIRTGAEPLASGARVLHATAVQCAIHHAAETHAPEPVPRLPEERWE